MSIPASSTDREAPGWAGSAGYYESSPVGELDVINLRGLGMGQAVQQVQPAVD